MFNPIANELLAREHQQDRLRQAEHERNVHEAGAHPTARRFAVRASLDNLFMMVRNLFKRPARADKQHSC